MKKGDKVKCIKNDGYERILEKGYFYEVFIINEKENTIDIGKEREFPIDYIIE